MVEKKKDWIEIIKTMIMATAIGLFIVWYYSGNEAVDSFVGVTVALFIANAVILLCAYKNNVSPWTYWSVVLLNIMGIVTQSVFILGPIGEQVKTVLHIMVALAAFVLCWLFCDKIENAKWIKNCAKNRNCSVSILWAVFFGFWALFFLLLCFILPEKNGVPNWIPLGPFSLQATELTKICVLLAIGYFYKDNRLFGANKKQEDTQHSQENNAESDVSTEKKDKKATTSSKRKKIKIGKDGKKGLISLLFFGLCGVFFMKHSEMGICLVLLCVYICMSFMYNKSKIFWCVLAFVIIAGVSGFCIVYNSIDDISYRWECPNGCVEMKDGVPVEPVTVKVNHKEIVCSDCGIAKYMKTPSFTCKHCNYKRFAPLPEGKTKDTFVCENCYGHPLLRGSWSGHCKKLYERFSVWLNYNVTKHEDIGFQMAQSEKSATLGGWFGNREYKVYIPNKTNDSVLAGMFNSMGFIAVLCVYFLYYLFFLEIRNIQSPIKMAALLGICFQALLAAMGNFNLFALTGIGVPLISTGGSSYMVTVMLIYFIFRKETEKKRS